MIYIISAVFLVLVLTTMVFILINSLSGEDEQRQNFYEMQYPSLNVLLIIDSELESQLDNVMLMRLDVENDEIIVTALDVDWATTVGGRGASLAEHYAYGTEMVLKAAIGEILNIEIDRYAIIGRQIFATMVDNFGGVVFDVTQNLEIDVPNGLPIIIDGGVATLAGMQAFSVLSFDDWDDASSLEVQEELLAAIINTRLSERNLSRSSVNFNAFINNVGSDISAMDGVRYLQFLENFKENEGEVRTFTLEIEDGAIISRNLRDFRAIFAPED